MTITGCYSKAKRLVFFLEVGLAAYMRRTRDLTSHGIRNSSQQFRHYAHVLSFLFNTFLLNSLCLWLMETDCFKSSATRCKTLPSWYL